MKARLMSVLIIVILGASCKVGPNYQRPKVQAPDNYRAAVNPAQPNAQTLADEKWFDVFKDDKLQELIRQALVSNYDLRVAVTRVDQARAQYGITRADQFPTITASSDFTVQRLSRG